MTVIFADTVTRLGRAVEASMESLYDLQTATINAENHESASLSDVFRTIRQTLRAEWELLMAFFKSCHAFGDDIAFLKESMGKESFEDCLNFLQELGETSAELVDRAEGLRNTIDIPILLFSQKQNDFLDLFKASSVPVQRRLETSTHDRNTTPIPVDLHSRDEETASFVNAALASLYPNGESMVFTTENHFCDMLALYDDVVTFWKTQHDEFLAGSKFMAGITVHRINQITDDWATSNRALKGTIAIISRACDAVSVEARGAPRPSYTPYPPVVQAETPGLEVRTQLLSWVEVNVGRASLLAMSATQLSTGAYYTRQIAPAAQTMSVVESSFGGVTVSSGLKDCSFRHPLRPPYHHSNYAETSTAGA